MGGKSAQALRDAGPAPWCEGLCAGIWVRQVRQAGNRLRFILGGAVPAVSVAHSDHSGV